MVRLPSNSILCIAPPSWGKMVSRDIHNSNDNSYVIKMDSIERNGSVIVQIDTLKSVDGDFLYKKLLTSEDNTLSADLKSFWSQIQSGHKSRQKLIGTTYNNKELDKKTNSLC